MSFTADILLRDDGGYQGQFLQTYTYVSSTCTGGGSLSGYPGAVVPPQSNFHCTVTLPDSSHGQTISATATYAGPGGSLLFYGMVITAPTGTEGGTGGGPPVPGCTNPLALNYNPAATVDDGSCVLPVRGCTNPAALNYNRAANVDDGSCVLPTPPRRGCTDVLAVNYDPMAVQSDGSCRYPVPAGVPPAAFVDPCPCDWEAGAAPAGTWTQGSC